MDKPNFLILVLDSARKDGFSCYGNKKKTTPNIDELAKESMVFDNAFSAGTWTPASHASIFSGKLPSRTGSTTPDIVFDSKRSIAKLFKEKGYYTFGMYTVAHITDERNYSKGFDEYIDATMDISRWSLDWRMWLDTLSDRIFGRRFRTRFTTKLFKEKLSEAEEPFFGFLNLVSSHKFYNSPFWIKNKFVETKGNEEKINKLMHDYNSKMEEEVLEGTLKVEDEDWQMLKEYFYSDLYRTDKFVGRILDHLKKEEIFDNTVILVTSDHGDEFGEHEVFEHGHIYDTCLNIPFILKTTDGKNGRFSKLVSHLDILPTFMKLAGFDFDGFTDGCSIFPVEEYHRDFIISEKGGSDEKPDIWTDSKSWAIRTEKYKFIKRKGFENELYNIVEDEEEQNNLIQEEKEKAEELEKKLLKRLSLENIDGIDF